MRSLTVTLPDDVVQAIEAKVAAGEYASESDLVRDGLEGFLADDPIVESWLRGDIVDRCRKRAADSSSMIPAGEILDRVERRIAAKAR